VPKNTLSYLKVCKRKDGKYYIDFKLNNKRYRLFSGRLIESTINPNSYPAKLRFSVATSLAKQTYDYIVSNNYSLIKPLNDLELFDSLIKNKLSEPLSKIYYKALKSLSEVLRNELKNKGELTVIFLDSIPLKYTNNTSFNTVRRHLNVLVNYLHNNGFPMPISNLKTRKQVEVLHSPIRDVRFLLNQIKEFNYNLYICCLLTYGCLLRPHQEIRLLKWEDFSDDLSHINLTGSKVKSKRNRIVPVPSYIREVLIKRDSNYNVFSNSIEPYNKGYFSLIWKRFKRLNPDVKTSVTIYSFRHTGAIEIFKRTESITKHQKTMGHSSINVSLTYLRGLEVPELTEGDMPVI
jgi:integrase